MAVPFHLKPMKSLGLLRLHHVKTKGISSIFRVFFVVYSQFLKVIDSFMVEGFLLCWFFDSSTFSSFFRLFRFFFERWPETIAVLRRADFRCVADFFLFFSFFCFFFGLFSSLGFSSGRARVPRRKSPRIKEDLVASLTKFRRVTIVKKKVFDQKKKEAALATRSIDIKFAVAPAPIKRQQKKIPRSLRATLFYGRNATEWRIKFHTPRPPDFSVFFFG